MDAFDVNLLSQVKPLNQKMSISQEQLHLKRKVGAEDKGKGKDGGKKGPHDGKRYDGHYHEAKGENDGESTIDITI